jgi:hypothetical protein
MTVRARKADGGYLQADEYEQLLKEAGDVRVLPLPEEGEGSVRTLLDGTYLQNIVFSKLRAIHVYRPAAVVVPLTDEAFQVFFVAPQISYGVVGRLRAVLAASGLAGEERDTVRCPRYSPDRCQGPPLLPERRGAATHGGPTEPA